ncbi:MAG TPA: DUF2232 domain-containing protein [Gemmatimonadaceae bacterium]|nr:DUF2232 domain-containing protein [Gemmatimonadaceae bacterium]
MTDVAQHAPRARGWAGLLLALAAFLLVPAIPVAGALLPVTDGYLLLLPAFAACTLLGWWAGGRGSLAVFWVLLTAYAFLQGRDQWGTYGTLLRAWAIILAGAFGVLALVDMRRPLFARALSATGMALVAALGITTALRSPSGVVERVVAQQLQQRNASTVAQLRALASEQPETWARFTRSYPGSGSPIDAVSDALTTVARAGVIAFPALLALQSLAALALAWALYHRVGRARIGPPLGALRDFRFNDQLVWGLIVGLTVLLLPAVSPGRAIALRMLRNFGVNLIVFFLALYALRGLGVISWVLPRRTLGVLVALGVLLALVPTTTGIALPGLLSLVTGAGVLGLADTWFDWRRLARPLS